MKIFIYSFKIFEKEHLEKSNIHEHELTFCAEPLGDSTVNLCAGYEAIMVFTGDDVSASVLQRLKENGIRFIATRAAGYDNIDLDKASELGLKIANVPAYSPYAIAEHAVALILALNRKIILAHEQLHQYDFRVDKLVGFDLHGATVGIIGTGTIGAVLVKILYGFGSTIIAYDKQPDVSLIEKYKVEYKTLDTLCNDSDVISLHLPLNEQTKYLLAADSIQKMKKGVIIINTSRGAVVNTNDIINGIRSGKIGGYGADVYEKEKDVFFFDRSVNKPADDTLDILLGLPNVLLTPHQGFATKNALMNIADTSFSNLEKFNTYGSCENELTKPELINDYY